MCREAHLYSHQTAARGCPLLLCCFFYSLICGKGKQDLWALDTRRDDMVAFTVTMVFGRKGERGYFALSINYV